eukprot:GGOE01019453.1.p1 GENE.GGOE01019453.1~~GGOE01019453.1.p1  ORF type:complete len:689 (+),score=128.47 GGOE01019453.1:219-2069(+)
MWRGNSQHTRIAIATGVLHRMPRQAAAAQRLHPLSASASESWLSLAGPLWLWPLLSVAMFWIFRLRSQPTSTSSSFGTFATIGLSPPRSPEAPPFMQQHATAYGEAQGGPPGPEAEGLEGAEGAPGFERPSGREAFEMLLQPYPYMLAYATMRRSKGKRTEVLRRLTSLERHQMDQVIRGVQEGTFRFTRVREKDMTSGHSLKSPIKRSLNKRQVISEGDQLLLHAMAHVLRTIYESLFSDSSYGYRAGRGCHDALQSIKESCMYSDFWIVTDVQNTVRNIHLDVLDVILREENVDERFIKLVNSAAIAGHFDVWEAPPTSIVEIPEGSVLASVLCNVVLDRLDKFVEGELKPIYTRGFVPPPKRAFERMSLQAKFAFAKYNISGNQQDLDDGQGLLMDSLNLSTDKPQDPGFRRLHYVRYGPQIFFGLTGREDEAHHVKEMLIEFFRCVGLPISEVVVQPSIQPIKFIGTEFATFQKRHSNRLGVKMKAPLRHIVKKMAAAGLCDETGYARASMRLYGAEKDYIVGRYVIIYLSLLNFFSFVANYHALSRYTFMILRNSCAKVLCAKYKFRSIRKVCLTFGSHLGGTTKVALPDPQDVQRVSSFTPGPIRFPTLL